MWPNGVLKWPNMVLKCTVPMGAIYFYFLWVSRPIGSLSGLFYHKNSPFFVPISMAGRTYKNQAH